MTSHLQEQIDQLRGETAFLGRALRAQTARLDRLTRDLDRYATVSGVSLEHLILTLQAARDLELAKRSRSS